MRSYSRYHPFAAKPGAFRFRGVSGSGNEGYLALKPAVVIQIVSHRVHPKVHQVLAVQRRPEEIYLGTPFAKTPGRPTGSPLTQYYGAPAFIVVPVARPTTPVVPLGI